MDRSTVGASTVGEEHSRKRCSLSFEFTVKVSNILSQTESAGSAPPNIDGSYLVWLQFSHAIHSNGSCYYHYR